MNVAYGGMGREEQKKLNFITHGLSPYHINKIFAIGDRRKFNSFFMLLYFFTVEITKTPPTFFAAAFR